MKGKMNNKLNDRSRGVLDALREGRGRAGLANASAFARAPRPVPA